MKQYKYIFSLLLLALIVVWGSIVFFLEKPLPLPRDGVFFLIENGESFTSVAFRLKKESIVSNELLLRIYSRINNFDNTIKAGEYNLSHGLSLRSLIAKLTNGDVISRKITFPEGTTLKQALDRLKDNAHIRDTLSGVDDQELTQLTGKDNSEGLFLADTYSYHRGTRDLDILIMANAGLLDVLEKLWKERTLDLPYKTAYEALILSSIIEKETALPKERAQISGVFIRRLNMGMRLQADPTVIYGLGSAFDGNLRRSHLNDKSNPYNTYRNNGLPPTPIALPGLESIIAAFNPDQSKAIYFVADGLGGHVFNATLDEHNAAVKKYLLKSSAVEN